jgi:hypothetical protein
MVRIQNGNSNNYLEFRARADAGNYYGMLFTDNNVGGYIAFRSYVGSGANNGANGDYMVYGTYTDHIFQAGSSETVDGKTEVFRIYANGDTRATGNSYAQAFYNWSDSSYYADLNGTTIMNYLRIAGGSPAVMRIGNGDTARDYFGDASRNGMSIAGSTYPHLYINADNASNTTHGGVFSMTGAISGGFRRFGIGVANWNPNEMSFGWYDNQTNPHYGVGINWGAPASVWFDTSHNWYVRQDVYAYRFYDRDNTARWVDPAGESRLAGHRVYCDLATGRGSYSQPLANLILVPTAANPTGYCNIEFFSDYNTPSDGAAITYFTGIDGGEASQLRIRLNNDYNDGIALWGGYIDFNCQTVDGASQGYRNNIFSWQRYGTEIMYLNSSAELGVAGNVRAPIYYDSNDTAWRMDPTDYSYFRYLKMRSSGTSSGTRALSVYQEGTGEINFGSYPGAWTSAVQIQDNSGSQFMWLSPLSSIGYGMIYHNAYPIYFYGGGGFAGAAHNGSLRSPIFYDSDDTTYYANFNTTGISINTRGAIRVTDYVSPNGYPNWSDVAWMGRYDSSQAGYPMYSPGDMFGIHFQRSSDGCSIGMISRGGGYNDYNTVINWSDDAGDILQFRFNNGVVAQINEGGGFYSPIYYDQNNSGYYVDPNGTSRIGGIQINAANSSNNEIRFYGVVGDNPGSYNHAGIFERIWRNGDESELLIFKGNDPDVSTIHDRLRLGACGRVVFHSYNTYGNIDDYISAAGTGNINGSGFFNGNDLYVVGNITAYYSDERLKDVIGPIPNSLDKIMSLSGFYYTNNEIAKKWGYTDDSIQLGLSAQEVQKVCPELVQPAPFDIEADGTSISGEHYLTVKYDRLIPVLVEAIKEQQTQMNDMKSEITELKKQLVELLKK